MTDKIQPMVQRFIIATLADDTGAGSDLQTFEKRDDSYWEVNGAIDIPQLANEVSGAILEHVAGILTKRANGELELHQVLTASELPENSFYFRLGLLRAAEILGQM